MSSAKCWRRNTRVLDYRSNQIRLLLVLLRLLRLLGLLCLLLRHSIYQARDIDRLFDGYCQYPRTVTTRSTIIDNESIPARSSSPSESHTARSAARVPNDGISTTGAAAAAVGDWHRGGHDGAEDAYRRGCCRLGGPQGGRIEDVRHCDRLYCGGGPYRHEGAPDVHLGGAYVGGSQGGGRGCCRDKGLGRSCCGC